jgi:transposase
MKKKKKHNIAKALTLKNNILNHHNKINLPLLNNINFIDNKNISGINFKKSEHKLINTKLNLVSDDLFKGKKKKDVLVKTIKVLLLPNEKQKQLLVNWMDAWIVMYNKVISIIKDERKQQSIVNNKPLKYNEMNLDNLKLNKLKYDLNSFKSSLVKKTKIDSHTLDYCIKDVLSSLDSSISNLNNGNCKKTRLRFLKKNKESKIIKIENNGSTITDKSFCTSKIGKFIKTIPNVNLKKTGEGTCIIHYKNNKFTILFKKKKLTIKKHLIKQQKVIALDPGHRTFLSGLSNEHLIEIGNNVDKKIKRELLKIDKIKTLKIKNKRRKLLKREKDLNNYINNLHWQTINYLTNDYNHILLGNYSTKSMVESEDVNKMNKRIGSTLRFYQLREKLKYKCILKSCNLGIVDEYNTTKACSNCSTLNDIGSSKEYNCKNCNKKYPRDINSSKNILLRGITG